MIVNDGRSNSVRQIDESRESITIIGGPDSGAGHLENPVDVGVVNGIIVVADDIRNEIVFFDEFGSFIKDVTAETSGTKARYIKVIAKNYGKCPTWHLGSGGQAWIFSDEITIN